MGDIHLLQRNDIYYFRIRLPHDIAPYFSRRELWKSLKTKNYKSAKTTITKLLYTTEWLFLHLRSGMFTDTQMKQFVKDYLHAYLNRCESIRSIGLVRYESEGHAYTDAHVIVDKSAEFIDDLIESSKRKLLIDSRDSWTFNRVGNHGKIWEKISAESAS